VGSPRKRGGTGPHFYPNGKKGMGGGVKVGVIQKEGVVVWKSCASSGMGGKGARLTNVSWTYRVVCRGGD